MKTFLLTFLFMIGLTVVHGQEKMQFSILGGYEHFKNEAQNKTTGYGIGCEFKYYLLKTLYAVGNFHTGIKSEFLPRTAIAEVGEIDFSMRWKTYEYKGGIGIGNDLYCKKAHKIYVQSTFGLSKTKQSVPQIENYRPSVQMCNENIHFLKYALSASLGYNYRIGKSYIVGLDYTGWWIIGAAYRSTCNVKIGFIF